MAAATGEYKPAKKIKEPVGREKRESPGDKVKNRSDDVLAVKYWLLCHGHKVDWDKKVNDSLVKAIEKFQKAKVKGIKGPDGVVDPERNTWKALVKATPKPLEELTGGDAGKSKEDGAAKGKTLDQVLQSGKDDEIQEKLDEVIASKDEKKYMEAVKAIAKRKKDSKTWIQYLLKKGGMGINASRVGIFYSLLIVDSMGFAVAAKYLMVLNGVAGMTSIAGFFGMMYLWFDLHADGAAKSYALQAKKDSAEAFSKNLKSLFRGGKFDQAASNKILDRLYKTEETRIKKKITDQHGADWQKYLKDGDRMRSGSIKSNLLCLKFYKEGIEEVKKEMKKAWAR